MELEKCRSKINKSGNNDSDGEEEEELAHDGLKIVPHTNKQYVQYWNLFAEDFPDLWKVFNADLDDDVFHESEAAKPPAKKRKTSNDLIVDAFNASTKVDKKRLELQMEEAKALKEQAKAIATAQQASELSALRNDRIAMVKQNRELTKELIQAISEENDAGVNPRKEAQRLLDLHRRRKANLVLTQGSSDSHDMVMDEIINGEEEIKAIDLRIQAVKDNMAKGQEKENGNNETGNDNNGDSDNRNK